MLRKAHAILIMPSVTVQALAHPTETTLREKRKDIMTDAGSSETGLDHYPRWLKDRLRWFQDLKFGLFVHWGPYSQWGCIESWPLVEEDTWARPDDLAAWNERDRDLERFRRDYWALSRTFNPAKFDPAPWAKAAKYAGMKYVAFTTKHHDGFCMFDTGTTDYRVTHRDCPFHANPRANITKEVFDTFREMGFAISCYFAKSDWHSPCYWCPDWPARDRNVNYDTGERPEIWAGFVDFVHRQVKELMTGYGPIDVLWLDGGQVRPPNQDIRMADMAEMARSHQPGLIVADRTVSGPYENILTPEQQIPDEPLGHPWESCLTMGNGWSYRPDDKYKSVRTLLHLLVDIVAKDGNLLLNIGPSPEGLFAPDALDRLRGLGDWMSVNSEAIHGAGAIAPYQEGRVRYTCKGDHVYAIVLADDGQDAPPPKITLGAMRPADGTDVRMLGAAEPLTWRSSDGRTEIALPVENPPCEHAWVLKFLPKSRH